MTIPQPQLKRPLQFAEEQLVLRILQGQWPPGTALPAERNLAREIGVTRQTLREALQRLARDRWIDIQHGKATRVNDYWRQGGLGILRTMAAYAEYLPEAFITHLLQARILFLPACAQAAAEKVPDKLGRFLETAAELSDQAAAYAAYDWSLQLLMVQNSGNAIYPLMLNDFEPAFEVLGQQYFELPQGRLASGRYYAELATALGKGRSIEEIVARAMAESLAIWRKFQPRNPKKEDGYRKSG